MSRTGPKLDSIQKIMKFEIFSLKTFTHKETNKDIGNSVSTIYVKKWVSIYLTFTNFDYKNSFQYMTK